MVVTVNDIGLNAIAALTDRYQIDLELVVDKAAIPGSYWGAPEAGIVSSTLLFRNDTPIHSLLHEASHIVCMNEGRRQSLHTDAGGDDMEESAVCYLQILLASYIQRYSRRQMFSDMDTWGYSFRLGRTQLWFEEDATDAMNWLKAFRLIDDEESPTWQKRI